MCVCRKLDTAMSSFFFRPGLGLQKLWGRSLRWRDWVCAACLPCCRCGSDSPLCRRTEGLLVRYTAAETLTVGRASDSPQSTPSFLSPFACLVVFSVWRMCYRSSHCLCALRSCAGLALFHSGKRIATCLLSGLSLASSSPVVVCPSTALVCVCVFVCPGRHGCGRGRRSAG